MGDRVGRINFAPSQHHRSQHHYITTSLHHYIQTVMKQDEFNELFRNRTKILALRVITLLSDLKYIDSDAFGTIRKQLVRSVTSTAANFRAVCRARSDRERFAKLCIVVEEADETLFWIEMIIEAGFIPKEKMTDCYKEAEEVLKVMAAYKKKLQR